MPVMLLLLLLWPTSTASAAGWHAPVDGAVAAPFAFSAQTPYRGGQRRGLRLRTRSGAVVRAACTGRVTFAGTVPVGALGSGRAVTVACGDGVRASVLPLGTTAARRGDVVVRGARLGTAAGTTVQLGARRGGTYVDPAPLLGQDAPGVPGPLPLGRAPAPRGSGPPRPPRLVAPRTAVPRLAPPATLALEQPAALSPGALAGVGLLAAGVGTGGLVRRRRRHGLVTGLATARQ